MQVITIHYAHLLPAFRDFNRLFILLAFCQSNGVIMGNQAKVIEVIGQFHIVFFDIHKQLAVNADCFF